MANNRWRIPFAITALALASTLASLTLAAEDVSYFESVEYGVSLSHPPAWKRVLGARPGVVLILQLEGDARPGAGGTTVRVSIPPIPEEEKEKGIALADVEKGLVGGMKRSVPDAAVVEAADTKLSGDPARRIVIAGHTASDNREVRSTIVICVHDRKVYSVILSGNASNVAKFEKPFDELVASFKFLKA